MASVEDILASKATVADKIRALDAQGFPRAEIARLLGKRYQHVRNVLEGDRQVRGQAQGMAEGEAPRFEVEVAPTDWRGGIFRMQLDAQGRLALPKEVIEAWGLSAGSVIMGELKGDTIELITGQTSGRRAQELVRKYIPEGVSLVDELIADRRAAAARGD